LQGGATGTDSAGEGRGSESEHGGPQTGGLCRGQGEGEGLLGPRQHVGEVCHLCDTYSGCQLVDRVGCVQTNIALCCYDS